MNTETKEQLRDKIISLEKDIVRLEVSIEHNQKHVEQLEKINADQHEQIMRLQDALVAREAPDAWADRKEDGDGAELSEEERAEIKRNKQLANANRQLLDMMGDDLFSSADEMIERLTKGATPTFERTHGNDES